MGRDYLAPAISWDKYMKLPQGIELLYPACAVILIGMGLKLVIFLHLERLSLTDLLNLMGDMMKTFREVRRDEIESYQRLVENTRTENDFYLSLCDMALKYLDMQETETPWGIMDLSHPAAVADNWQPAGFGFIEMPDEFGAKMRKMNS
jgi:hypothetical protein